MFCNCFDQNPEENSGEQQKGVFAGDGLYVVVCLSAGGGIGQLLNQQPQLLLIIC